MDDEGVFVAITVTTLQSGLRVPWDVAPLPDGRMLVSERVGNLLVLFDNTYGRLRSVVFGVDGALYLTTSNGTADRVLRITATQP